MENTRQLVRGAGLWGSDLMVFDSLPSTNAWALEHAGELKHGDVVRAIRQSTGRGRFDRTWVSPGKCCLTLSAVLKSGAQDTSGDALLLPVAAIALRNALKEFGLTAMLKWPNDVLVAGKKIAGILAESVTANSMLVLGIGLNVNITAPALSGMTFEQPPTSMAVERARLFDVDLVCRRLLIDLEKAIEFTQQNGPASVAARWKENDCLIGRTIAVKGQQDTVTGRYDGMQADGQLALVDAAGKRRLFWSGDVTVMLNGEC